MDAALDVPRDCGAELAEVDPGWSAEVPEAAMTYLGHLFGASMVGALEKAGDLPPPYARRFAAKPYPL